MPIPDYPSLMLPVLKLSADGEEHRFRDVVERLATELGITEAERAELLPSGSGRVLSSGLSFGSNVQPNWTFRTRNSRACRPLEAGPARRRFYTAAALP
jgi:hypothetical protein